MVVPIPKNIEDGMNEKTKRAFYALTQNLFVDDIEKVLDEKESLTYVTKNMKILRIEKGYDEFHISSYTNSYYIEDIYRVKLHGNIDSYLPIFSDKDFQKLLYSSNIIVKVSESRYDNDRQVTIYVPFYLMSDILRIISKYYPLNSNLSKVYNEVVKINRIEIAKNIYARISPNIHGDYLNLEKLLDKEYIDDKTLKNLDHIDKILRKAFIYANDPNKSSNINVYAVPRNKIKDTIPKDYSIYQIKNNDKNIDIYVVTLLLNLTKENKPVYCPGIVIERKRENGKDILNVLTPKGNIKIDLNNDKELSYISRHPLKFITQEISYK